MTVSDIQQKYNNIKGIQISNIESHDDNKRTKKNQIEY